MQTSQCFLFVCYKPYLQAKDIMKIKAVNFASQFVIASPSFSQHGLWKVFTLRHSRHVGGRKQKITHLRLLFVHQQLHIAALLSVSLEIGCKPPIPLLNSMTMHDTL